MDESRRPYDYVAVAGIVSMLAVGIWGYVTLPKRIPTNFGFDGHATAWGPSWTVFLVPIAGVFFTTIVWLGPKLNIRPNLPFSIAEERVESVNALSNKMMSVLLLVIVPFFIAMTLETVAGAQHETFSRPFVPTTLAMLASVFACIGIYTKRIHRAAREPIPSDARTPSQ
ncbi:MAG TPA: DUF1648 domain-containing protein [Candidatus Acidoferrales bacterium]|jgi:uncharacterized membrane protein|nr:DUF1648 domain-containing protein [Candidatus Acidoferrales bacterium]